MQEMRPAQRWLEDEGIVYVGFWEPIYFYRQRGSCTQNTESLLDFIKSEQYIAHLAEIGVNHLWCNFSKGYGTEFEHAEQLKIKAMNPIARKYGMRVIAYCTGGSLTPETLRYEAPDVDDWCAKTEDGKFASYGGNEFQNFRARPCYTSPGYMAFQKRVIARALDYGCDGVHFDNTNMSPEPMSCKCQRCLTMFREFLARKYDNDDPKRACSAIERWGRTDFSHAKEPWYDIKNNPVMQREIRVANQQDWFLFRQEIFQAALLEWAKLIHERGGAVEFNAGKNFGSNYRAYGAINDERLLPHTDILFNEGTVKLGYNQSGSPLTRIREHKVVQAFDVPMMNYNRTVHQMAEAFSFNPGMVGMWEVDSDPAKCPEKTRFFKFYRKYRHYQTRQVSLAETAVLLDNDSLLFSQMDALHAVCAMTQVLQEEHIPFNFIYSSTLDTLSQYRLLVISSMHCLKEADAEKIGRWVKSGGSLLTTGRTGIYDDNFRRRTRVKTIKSLNDLFHSKDPENLFSELTGETHATDFVKSVGSGEVAHIAELQHPVNPNLSTPAEWMIEDRCINRPINSNVVCDSIERLLPAGTRNLQVSSSQHLLVDICRRSDTREGLIHLFNVSYAKNETAAANVHFRWTEKVESLTWIGYDREETPVEFDEISDGTSFSLQGIRESALIIVNKK
jgi:hypothetical protein